MQILVIDNHFKLSISQIDAISKKESRLHLKQSSEFRNLINKGADVLKKKLHHEGYIYGVTTGYGNDCTRPIPMELVYELPDHLMRFHGCGLGNYLTEPQTRATLAIRLATLCQGYSGVSYALLGMLETLLEKDILPVIPSEGSVGASGDLTPLSYVAAVLSGERHVWKQGQIISAAEAFQQNDIKPYKLQPKEALAIMNGTAVMTALSCEAYSRAEYLVELASRLTSMTCLALEGNPIHFDEVLFMAKPHPGQSHVASLIRSDLSYAPKNFPIHRLQDRYSTRCAPHIIGVLADMLPCFKNMIEIEINSASDNPLIDIFSEKDDVRILSGGNFYGGHIAFAMDSLKNLVANVADLLDRQMASLVDPKMNHGLPPNLSGAQGNRAHINHGLKAIQIATSAWTAEALKGALPASIFSRSTESHNQDKVSMGTIAARDSLRVLELTEQVCAAHMIATLQALRIREQQGNISDTHYPDDLKSYINLIKNEIPYIQEDHPLDITLKRLVSLIQSRTIKLYKRSP
ncbi:MAG: histidine ammonia-lyase [Chlamydiales bacterium]|jgi:histidine ammonia-lyase|nr:histidine ammonia-lyase [Chlamydiales bacterium]